MSGMRALREVMDDLLPFLAFLAYVLVEAVVIYGILKWAGAV
jgi:hypothetical protein